MRSKETFLDKIVFHHIPSIFSLSMGAALIAVIMVTGYAPGSTLGGMFDTLNPLTSKASGELFNASPNPVQVCDGATVGMTTLSWNPVAGTQVEVRKDGQTGAVIAQSSGPGTQQVSGVTNNTKYYLYSVATSWTYNKRTGQWEQVVVRTELSNLTITHTTQGCTPPPGQAPITGTFIVPQLLSTANIQTLFAEFKQYKMDTVIIGSTKQRTTADCSKNEFAWGNGFPGKLDTVLNAAKDNNIKVYIGLISAWCEQANIPAITNAYKDTVQYIVNTYGAHSAFAGWYIPDEPSLAWWDTPSTWHPYWAALASSIKLYSAKPIIVSPILGGGESRTPAEIGARALAFKQATGIDIQAWQDSEQSWALNLNWQKRGTSSLSDYFNAISSAIGQNAFWADIEIGNCCEGWPNQGGGYYPTSFARVRKQIESSTKAAKVVTWIHQLQMSSLTGLPATVVAPGSVRLGTAYRAWYRIGTDLEYINPVSYTWITPPSGNYPDSGREMIDGISGDPKRFDDLTWVGIVQNVSMEFALGSVKKVDWVGVHVLNNNSVGIKFPNRLRIGCKTTGQFQEISSTNLQVTKYDSEYVLSNTTPLNASCSSLQVSLDSSGGWTFLSEVEIVGRK